LGCRDYEQGSRRSEVPVAVEGNALFNEGLPEVSNIAEAYMKRMELLQFLPKR
jgi:hypothetical protein